MRQIESASDAHANRLAAAHYGEQDEHDAMLELAARIADERTAKLADDDLIAGFHSATSKDAARIRAAYRDDALLASLVRELVELEIARDSRDLAENAMSSSH
jgi:hypothetical protein